MSEVINKNAKVLIISWSPIPTPKYQKIEGSGQRFFGLAKGLQKNGVKDITIAIGTIYPLDVKQASGIKLFNYDFDEKFSKRIAEYDTVIFNYAIHGAAFIAQHIPRTTQVIIDVYGPAYIESLARNPEDLVSTYIGNLAAVNEVFNKVLPRGDFFLYANDAQEKFYTGVLTTLGVINQFSYNTQRLLHVPFGIDKPDSRVKYKNPYTDYGIKNDDFTLLWFGGLYPWFDITPILETIKNNKDKNIKFVIVGGNNPQNQHPDFIKHYQAVVDYISENELSHDVILIDWVDFNTRRKYYDYADAIISLNGEGKENVYSWRTRVMDYVGSTTPLITNGGDPLSDELIESGAAFRVSLDKKDGIKELLLRLSSHREELKAASKKMRDIQPKYYWETVTKTMASEIYSKNKPFSEERAFRLQNNIIETDGHITRISEQRKRSIGSIARSIARKIKEKGFRNTLVLIKAKVRHKLSYEYRKRFPKNEPKEPRIVIVSNQFNNTGAPFVIIDLIKDMKERYPALAKMIKFITFTPVEASNVMKLNQLGIDVDVHVNRDLPIEFNTGDVVVFNSFAMSRTTIYSAINAVSDGRLKKILWYGHEAAPDSFIDSDVRDIFKSLLNNNKAKVFAVSKRTQIEYKRFFGTSRNIVRMPFRFIFPLERFKERSSEDFSKLKFITTGSLMDMRKGQFPILYAFLDFHHNFYLKNPANYRDFHLSFIGAYEKSDVSLHAPYHIQNILKQLESSAEGLGKRFTLLPVLSHDEALNEIESANVTICYSLLEAMGIFVYEGMATGHPIIRNESAGKDEQLIEGKNGYAVSNDDFAGFVDVIETILNKSKTSDEELVRMSKLSVEIAKKATSSDYFMVEDIKDVFETTIK